MPTSLALVLALQAPAGPHHVAPVEDPWRTETPPRRGVGMLAAGGALTFSGVILAVTAGSLLASVRCTSCDDTSGGAILLSVGVAALAVGVPLLGAGVHQFRVWRAWEVRHRVSLRPHLGRSPGAWSVGLTLRF